MTLRTVTLSPGFDHVVKVDCLLPGGVSRVLEWEVLAAGKGVNVARTATLLGAASVAYSLVGEVDELEFVERVEAFGSAAVTVAVPGHTRRNLTLLVQDTDQAASHSVGPRLSTGDDCHADTLIDRLVEDAQPGDVVTFNGAVPQQIRSSIWMEAATALYARGVALIADVQDGALVQLLETGLVLMAKPNHEEARALTQNALDVNDLVAASDGIRAMLRFRVKDPIVTLGPLGVLHMVNGQLTRTWCHVENASIVVGAGDAFLAGYCAALTADGWGDLEAVDVGTAVASAHITGAAPGELHSVVRSALAGVCHESMPE